MATKQVEIKTVANITYTTICDRLKNISFLSFDGLRTQTKEITLQIESKSDVMVSKKGASPAQRLLQLGWFRRLLVVAGFD